VSKNAWQFSFKTKAIPESRKPQIKPISYSAVKQHLSAGKRTNSANHIQSKSTSSGKGKLYILKESRITATTKRSSNARKRKT